MKQTIDYIRKLAALYKERGINGRAGAPSRGARHFSIPVRLGQSLRMDDAISLGRALALDVGARNVVTTRRAGCIVYQIELDEKHWQYYDRQHVSGLGVGLADGGRQVDFDFADGTHAMLAGTVGSGKTVGLQSILYSLMTTHAPDELGVVAIDPHRDLEAFTGCSHLIMPLAHDAADIDRAILWTGQEFARREAGNRRDATRLVITIDEAENSIGMDETRRAIVSKIAAGARKYNIHLVCATQRPTQTALPFLHLLANKFCFQVASARESAFVSGFPGLGCQFLSGSGDAQHVTGANVTRFQVAQVSEADAAGLERAEVARPELDEEDTAKILNIPPDGDDRPPGRKANEIEPRKVAVYLHRGPENVSIAWADRNLDLRRYNHAAHKDFSLEIVNELSKLKSQMEAQK